MKQIEVLLLVDMTPASRFSGIAAVARQNGWNLTVEDKNFPPKNLKWDGVLIMLDADNKALREFVVKLRKCRIPVVDITYATSEVRLTRVCADNRAMGRIAAGHFRECGLQRAAWFSHHWGGVQKMRFEGLTGKDGFPDAMRLVGDEMADAHGDFRPKLYEIIRNLPKPIGIFAYSDFDATRVLNACRASGIDVPEEVAILGVDDNKLLCENQSITMSSIRHPHEQIGYEAAHLLGRMMSGESAPPRPRLIAPLGIAMRQSTNAVAVEDPLVRQALTIIKRNLSKQIVAPEIAREIGVRPGVLSSAFHTTLGHSLAHEIIRQRLIRARLLIAERDLKLEAIAAETGFCSAAHFSNAFKKTCRVTPRQWRSSMNVPVNAQKPKP